MRHRIDELEKILESKLDVLRQFESDLSFRQIPRAATLLSQVDKWIAQPNRLADEPDVRESVRTSMDRFITVQRDTLIVDGWSTTLESRLDRRRRLVAHVPQSHPVATTFGY